MNFGNLLTKLKSLWLKYNNILVLFVLIAVFWGYTVFIAFNLELDIVPDEPFHFDVAKNFSTTWGLPEEDRTTRSLGIYIRQNPYLSYWIYGRAINLIDTLVPNANSWQRFVYLRVMNSLFSVGTVIFVYLLSKELIKNKWWQLLPVFTLTNTLMFVLLSSGVNYDNLANMFSAAAILFLVRVLNKKEFFNNSVLWMIFIALGTWTKETILPLALAMSFVWLLFVIKNRIKLTQFPFKSSLTIFLSIILLLLLAATFTIYGINLIRFQSVTPSCRDYYSQEFCSTTPLAKRRAALALPEKPNMIQAFRQGYPEPIRYAFDTWVRAMLMKIFGIMGGQRSYYPIGISYFHILLYWMLALALRYFRKTSFTIYSLAGILGFYSLTLFIKNYDIELAYGFIQVAHQGRYIFPVIGIVFVLFSLGLSKVPKAILRYPTLIATLLLFLYSGPIRFVLYYSSIFSDWFI